MPVSTLSFQRILGLAVVAVGAACQKPAPEPESVLLPAGLKAYTLFEPGTYWIYRDSVTRQLDSVWVVSTQKDILRIGAGGTFDRVALKYEAFTVRTSSTISGSHYYTIHRECDLPYRESQSTKGPCWVLERGRYLPNSTADAGGELVFPYSIDKDKPTFLIAYTAVMYPYWYSQPTILNGATYAGLLQVKLTTDISEGGWPTHYYWVPGQGVVLRRINRNGQWRTWHLVRNHIVQ
ncbi:hypothetical protein [Hymenobacter sp. UYP22]|uniref:hypothetical protein n=1 Tax=Hymenobacter sp. UYP22 TaxID=3156348 RepID=UPI003397F82C